MVTCIASDAHKPYERTTYMADIKEYMEQEYSFEYSKKLLYDNPKRSLHRTEGVGNILVCDVTKLYREN